MSTISVIIPTYQEAASIAQSVRAVSSWADEVIVVDASSPDGTAQLAAAAGAHVLLAAKGRGLQLRAGAAAANGDILVFLHADAQLGAGARDAMLRRLQQREVLGGNFRLVFEGTSLSARLFTFGNDLRRRLFRVYYGDSVLFVRREVYESLGGFEPLPIFEDYALIRRLERHAGGRTEYIREVEVRVSARRFERAPLRTLLNWALLQSLYSFAHVHPDRLASFYADIRGRAGTSHAE